MPKYIIFFSSLLGIFFLLMIGAALTAKRRVSKAVRSARRHLGPKKYFSYADLAGLPAPVQKYFRTVLKDGQEYIQFVETQQKAQIRRYEEGKWTDVEAREYFSAMDPALIWHARMRDAKYAWRTANLVYEEGTGSGFIKLYSGITLSEPSGPEADRSLLIRYLSETVWFPTALLPGTHLRWEAMEDNCACAIMSDHGMTVSATFYFSESGEIEKITTKDKFRDLKSGFSQEHFTMYCRNWAEREGIRIPLEVDFEWNFEKKDFLYARFFIEDVHYTFSA